MEFQFLSEQFRFFVRNWNDEQSAWQITFAGLYMLLINGMRRPLKENRFVSLMLRIFRFCFFFGKQLFSRIRLMIMMMKVRRTNEK